MLSEDRFPQENEGFYSTLQISLDLGPNGGNLGSGILTQGSGVGALTAGRGLAGVGVLEGGEGSSINAFAKSTGNKEFEKVCGENGIGNASFARNLIASVKDIWDE